MFLGTCDDLIFKGVQKLPNGNEYVDFEGIVSTEHLDHMADITVQDGVDWDYFKNHGIFNYEHSDKPEDFVGLPLDVKRNAIYEGKKGTWVKGRLLLHQARAREVYKAILALDGTGRRIGLSIQGRVLLRDPLNRRRILKSIIPKVSFTFNPINPHTFVDISKGVGEQVLQGSQDDLSVAVSRTFPDYSAEQRQALTAVLWLLLD